MATQAVPALPYGAPFRPLRPCLAVGELERFEGE
jgi:hypothetical protein